MQKYALYCCEPICFQLGLGTDGEKSEGSARGRQKVIADKGKRR